MPMKWLDRYKQTQANRRACAASSYAIHIDHRYTAVEDTQLIVSCPDHATALLWEQVIKVLPVASKAGPGPGSSAYAWDRDMWPNPNVTTAMDKIAKLLKGVA
jgi:hypothetical protein